MSPVAILNVLGHAAAVYSMFQSGGGTATHVVKAAEPVVSVILTLLLFGIIPHTFTAFSLVPICYGVAFASTKGNLDWDSCVSTFTTNSAKLAMFSNFCFALRSIVRKQIPQEFKDKVGADNDMALTTILSLAFTIPLALAFEDMDAVKSSWNGLGDAGQLAYVILED
jgi:drug/metabolite transporter (DMT)-like permease